MQSQEKFIMICLLKYSKDSRKKSVIGEIKEKLSREEKKKNQNTNPGRGGGAAAAAARRQRRRLGPPPPAPPIGPALRAMSE